VGESRFLREAGAGDAGKSQSSAFPSRRKEDRAGIVDCYISRVENGKFEVKKRIPKENLAANMPLRHNLSAMPV
jgi:hypothetical protein